MKSKKLFFLLFFVSLLSLASIDSDACPPGYESTCGALQIMEDGRTMKFVCDGSGNLQCCYKCPEVPVQG